MKPTQEQVIAWAREAGFRTDPEGEVLEGDGWHIQTDIVERFATLAYEAGLEDAEKNIRHFIAATPISVQTRVYLGEKEVSMLKMTHEQINEAFK